MEDHSRRALTLYLEQLRSQVNTTADDVTTVSSSTVVGSSVVLVDATSAAVTVTLVPALNWIDQVMRVKKTDTGPNYVLIVPQSGEKVDNTATVAITQSYTCLQLVSDGSNWWIV